MDTIEHKTEVAGLTSAFLAAIAFGAIIGFLVGEAMGENVAAAKIYREQLKVKP